MRKLFVVLVAIFLMATSAFALVESENGPQHITTCWVTDMGSMTSGEVVVLQTTAPTYWGREVTGSTSQGRKPYGVVVDVPNPNDLDTGTWIKVQTYGYCPIVQMASNYAVTANSSFLITSGEVFKGGGHEYLNSISTSAKNSVTGNSVWLESKTSPSPNSTFTGKMWLGW